VTDSTDVDGGLLGDDLGREGGEGGGVGHRLQGEEGGEGGREEERFLGMSGSP